MERDSPPAPSTPPDRYVVQDEGAGRCLYCREAPEVRVLVQRGLTTTAAAARKAPEGSIFLDGAAQGGPFLDAERRVFNLDHHEGCVRSFTLSTCEQALVLVMRGLDLKERPWTLHANDPDLDTVVALWVLLNAPHVVRSEDTRVRDLVIPLVKVEGVLDVHGPDRTELVGLPTPTLDESLRTIARLRDREVLLRRSGAWDSTDLATFTAEQLRALDAVLYPAGYFLAAHQVEVLLRQPLSDQRVVVVCRAEGGIYDAETELRRLYGRRLGVIALQKDERTYTLRQVDPFLPDTLDAVYARLNLLDPAVRSPAASDRWGGSSEIGGSPRGSGTRLAAADIAAACREALQRPTAATRARAVAWAVVALGLALTGSGLVSLAPLLAGHPSLAAVAASWSTLPLASTWGAAALAVLLMALGGARWPRWHGLRRPFGVDWLWLLPVAALAAAAGGAWAPLPMAADAEPTAAVALVGLVLGAALAAEGTFRALAHGTLARAFPVMHEGGRWFLSLPTLATAALYAAVTPLVRVALGQALPSGRDLILVVAGAALMGLTTAAARERSGSVAVPIVFHLAGIALALALAR
jgi:hypothetical protein